MIATGKGFTLLELMIVVALLGILASIAISGFLDAQRKTADKAAQSDAVNAAIVLRAASD